MAGLGSYHCRALGFASNTSFEERRAGDAIALEG